MMNQDYPYIHTEKEQSPSLNSKLNPMKLRQLIHNILIDNKKRFHASKLDETFFRGKRGIRTPGTVTRSPHFECGPFDHSGIFPFF